MLRSGLGGACTQIEAVTPDWTFLCGTWTGQSTADSIKLYIDGMLADTAAPFSQGTGSPHNLRIGCPSDTSFRWFDGIIDEARIYNRVLSATEVEALYLLPTAPNINCEDLSGYDYGAVAVGACSPEQSWTIVNEGAAELTGSIAVAGADPGEFEITQGAGAFALQPSETLDLSARFCPTATGRKTAALRIASNDPDEDPCDVSLGGGLSELVVVPGGTFQMGDPWGEGDPDELPVHAVTLDFYQIDRYEVTNLQYAAALNWAYAQGGLIEVTNGVVSGTPGAEPYCSTTLAPAGAPHYGNFSRITWSDDTFGVVAGKGNHPVAVVSWYGAVAFCNWRSAMEGRPLCYDLSTWTCNFDAPGYRLPTEAEWEMAAAWDLCCRQRHYRFGEHSDGCGFNCLDGERANYGNSGDPYESGAQPWTAPVGFYDGALHAKGDFGWPGSQQTYQTQDAASYFGAYGHDC